MKRFLPVLWGLLLHSLLWAHESRPMYIEITELESEIYSLKLKIPKSIPVFNLPQIIFPDGSKQKGHKKTIDQSDAYLQQCLYHCPGGLAGQKITIKFPLVNPSVSSLIQLKMLSGVKHSKFLSPKKTSWLIPQDESWGSVALQYTQLGIQHILEGFDHLLFVLCLLFLAQTPRRIFITITGFTLAHSITLALSALNLAQLPIPPVEAVIALSIVFLATEIAQDSRDTLTYRYPISVSISFGLLHGFGFAAVLKEIGLPQTEVVTSLLFFNLGVEIGQILFVLFVVLLFKTFVFICKLSSEIVIKKIERPTAYIVGSLASFWLIERVYSFWL